MKIKKMYIITRPSEGISSNAGIRQTLLDNDDKPMEFETKGDAIEFMSLHEIEPCDYDIEEKKETTR